MENKNKPQVLIVGHIDMGKTVANQLLSLKGTEDVIIVQDGKVVQGDPFVKPPSLEFKNIVPLNDSHIPPLVEYADFISSKPKHHNSSWGTPIKKKINKRKQQRKSRKINRRK